MQPTHVLQMHDGDYAAVKLDDGWHFADGTGWVDPSPVIGAVISVRTFIPFTPITPIKEKENAQVKP